jgi:hypothetical protein
LSAHNQSTIHHKISQGFVGKVFKRESSYKGFTLNKGKAGHIRQLMKKARRKAELHANAA